MLVTQEKVPEQCLMQEHQNHVKGICVNTYKFETRLFWEESCSVFNLSYRIKSGLFFPFVFFIPFFSTCLVFIFSGGFPLLIKLAAFGRRGALGLKSDVVVAYL